MQSVQFEWVEHKTVEGKPYFFNPSTNLSSWEKPAVPLPPPPLPAPEKPETRSISSGRSSCNKAVKQQPNHQHTSLRIQAIVQGHSKRKIELHRLSEFATSALGDDDGLADEYASRHRMYTNAFQKEPAARIKMGTSTRTGTINEVTDDNFRESARQFRKQTAALTGARGFFSGGENARHTVSVAGEGLLSQLVSPIFFVTTEISIKFRRGNTCSSHISDPRAKSYGGSPKHEAVDSKDGQVSGEEEEDASGPGDEFGGGDTSATVEQFGALMDGMLAASRARRGCLSLHLTRRADDFGRVPHLLGELLGPAGATNNTNNSDDTTATNSNKDAAAATNPTASPPVAVVSPTAGEEEGGGRVDGQVGNAPSTTGDGNRGSANGGELGFQSKAVFVLHGQWACLEDWVLDQAATWACLHELSNTFRASVEHAFSRATEPSAATNAGRSSSRGMANSASSSGGGHKPKDTTSTTEQTARSSQSIIGGGAGGGVGDRDNDTRSSNGGNSRRRAFNTSLSLASTLPLLASWPLALAVELRSPLGLRLGSWPAVPTSTTVAQVRRMVFLAAGINPERQLLCLEVQKRKTTKKQVAKPPSREAAAAAAADAEATASAAERREQARVGSHGGGGDVDGGGAGATRAITVTEELVKGNVGGDNDEVVFMQEMVGDRLQVADFLPLAPFQNYCGGEDDGEDDEGGNDVGGGGRENFKVTLRVSSVPSGSGGGGDTSASGNGSSATFGDSDSDSAWPPPPLSSLLSPSSSSSSSPPSSSSASSTGSQGDEGSIAVAVKNVVGIGVGEVRVGLSATVAELRFAVRLKFGPSAECEFFTLEGKPCWVNNTAATTPGATAATAGATLRGGGDSDAQRVACFLKPGSKTAAVLRLCKPPKGVVFGSGGGGNSNGDGGSEAQQQQRRAPFFTPGGSVDGLEEEDGVDEFSKRHELVTSQRLRWGSGPSPSSSPTPTTAFSGLFRTKAVAWSANVPLDELDEAIANDGKKGFVVLRASTEKYAEASSSRRSQEFDVDPYDYDAGRGVSTCGGGRESGGEWRGGASSSAPAKSFRDLTKQYGRVGGSARSAGSPAGRSTAGGTLSLLRAAESEVARSGRTTTGSSSEVHADDGIQKHQPPSKIHARSQQRTHAALERNRNKNKSEATGGAKVQIGSGISFVVSSPEFLPDEGIISADDEFSDI